MGIRRSRGRWLLLHNIDDVFSLTFLHYLARNLAREKEGEGDGKVSLLDDSGMYGVPRLFSEEVFPFTMDIDECFNTLDTCLTQM